MAYFTNRVPTQEQLDYIKIHVTADFERGLLFWRLPFKGRNMGKSIGSKDSNGYIKTKFLYFPCYAHQVIYFLYHGEWPRSLLDHKNRIRHDNRPENLVKSSHKENALNVASTEEIICG